MICSKCGKLGATGSRFCTHCGSPLVPTPLPATEVVQPTFVQQPGRSSQALLGRTIDNKYRLDALLGVGGMGAVYRATRLLIGDVVALKLMHPEQISTPQATERFRREAQAAARLKHFNAVMIHDFGVSSDGLPYLVMELVEGESLRDLLARQGPLASPVAAEILIQIAAALDEAHRQNIVHRDLKPENILVQNAPSGLRVKVLDFGIAKLRDLQTGGTLTQAGAMLGTPYYMSPEQCRGEELDGRSDVYSLGIVLFELLTGVMPFTAPSASAVIVQHIQQPPPAPRSINPSISREIETVVLHALQKRRDDRPAGAGALAQEFLTALNKSIPNPPLATDAHASRSTNAPAYAPQPAPVIATPNFQTPAPKTSKAPLVLGLLFLAVLVAAGAFAYFYFFASPKPAIMAEIGRGNLVNPEGSSAYDLYQKAKGRLNSSETAEIAATVTPQLETRGNEIIAKLHEEAAESEAEWTEALRLFTWLNELRADPQYESRKNFAQGRLELFRQDYPKAIASFRRAIALDASWALPFNSLGRAYVNAKNRNNAKDNYVRATQVEPDWIYPYINLAGLCLDLGNYEEAEAAAQRALEIDAQKPSPYYYLGMVYEKAGDPCTAAEKYRKALELAGSSTAPGFSVEGVRRKLEKLGC